MSGAGSIFDAIFGGRRSKRDALTRAANQRSRSAAAAKRADAAANKLDSLLDQADELETELAHELTEIDARWMATAAQITPVTVPLERTDVRVTKLVLAWVPTA